LGQAAHVCEQRADRGDDRGRDGEAACHPLRLGMRLVLERMVVRAVDMETVL
jgi:hypothetical protein